MSVKPIAQLLAITLIPLTFSNAFANISTACLVDRGTVNCTADKANHFTCTPKPVVASLAIGGGSPINKLNTSEISWKCVSGAKITTYFATCNDGYWGAIPANNDGGLLAKCWPNRR